MDNNNSLFEPSGFFTSKDETEKLFSDVTEISKDGGMCFVGKFLLHGKWHTIKRLKPEFLNNTIYKTALEKEFEIGLQLDHPNIVRYLHKGYDKKGVFIIQEYIDGITLREAFQDKDFVSKNSTDKIILQLIGAIDYLHKHQIYHLDLKPENILLSHKGGNIKLIDFGLATTDAFQGIASGTKKYASPEQIKEPSKQGARSDLYSFGLFVLELFTGDVNKKLIDKLPQQYRKIIKACLNESPINRPKNISEVEHSVTRYYQSRKKKLILTIGLILFGATISYFLFSDFSQQDKNLLAKPFNSSKDNKNSALEEGENNSINQPINSPTTISKNEKTNARELISEQEKSKAELAKINKGAKKMAADTIVSHSDSMKFIAMANNLYSSFKNRVLQYDQGRYFKGKSRKLVLLEIKDSCYTELFNKWVIYAEQFEKGTPKYFYENKVFSSVTKRTKSKIDSLAWNNGIPN
jgi:serine/threonine protein kinase